MRRKDLRSRCSRDLLRSKILTSYVLTRMVKKERQVNNEPPESTRAASKDLRMANCEEEALAASSSSSSYSSSTGLGEGLNPKGSPIGEARKTLEEERVADGANGLWILPRAAKA